MRKHAFQEHLLVLSTDEFYNYNRYLLLMHKQMGMFFPYYFDASLVMINQLMFTFHRTYVSVYEARSGETWYWGTNAFVLTNRNLKYDYNDDVAMMVIFETLFRVVKFLSLLFTFGFISTVNALMIRVTIKSSVIVAFWYFKIEDQFMRRNRIDMNSRAHIYRALGSTGAEAAYLDRHRISKTALTFSLLCSMVVYYGMFIGCNKLWTMLAFNNTYSGMVHEEYFFYVNYIELLTFLFIRTRSSIKYFPKLITVLNMAYLMYVNSFMYAAQQESLVVLNNASLLIFFYFIVNYEMEATRNWNPFGSHTPSINNPRCAYHHVSQSSQWSIGFDIMTMFQPVRFKESFPE